MRHPSRIIFSLLLAVVTLFAGCQKAPQAPEVVSAPEVKGCLPQCEGKECGDDTCRGVCGECKVDWTCNAKGLCEPPPCVPACDGKECGDDGCGGNCGECTHGRTCGEEARCVIPPCQPNCTNKACGSDNCGGSCGICDPGFVCRKYQCIDEPCTPDCMNRVCGDDGCGGSCGVCETPNQCKHGRCERRIAVGFFVGDGTESWRKAPPSIGTFVSDLGRAPAIAHSYLGFPANWSGTCEYSELPKAWLDEWLGINPVGTVMFSLLPQCGFQDFVEDFLPGNPAYDATLKLAEAIAKMPEPVLLRFAHDMNTHWYPWATCYFGNRKDGCARTPDDYRAAFANFAGVIHQFSQGKGKTVWSPHEFEPYWREKYADYPRYDAFYPGDDAVDWVALDFFYAEDKPPRPGTVANRIRGFYDDFAAARKKPMMIAETSVLCRIDEALSCVSKVGDFSTSKEWWGNWGTLETSRSRGAADKRCKRLYPESSHLVFAAAPNAEDPTGKPHDASGYYVGGTAFAVNWDQGMNFEKGNVLAVSARRGEGDVSPQLQIELCDVNAPECDPKAPCCEKGTYSAFVAVDNTDWDVHVVPLSDFKPTEEGSGANMDFKKIRAVKLHLLAEKPSGNLAPLHLDAMGVGKWAREGGPKCKAIQQGYAEQLFSPHMCYEWPFLKAILWNHDRQGAGNDVRDTRIQDWKLFKALLTDPCFMGSFF